MDTEELWKDDRIIPVVTVNDNSGEVLMVGYMNKDAYEHTMKTHRVWYYSRHRKKISMKGAHSGNTQRIMSITADDKMESLLIRVQQKGQICSKDGGHDTCYINKLYKRSESKRRRKFGKVDIDENFDFSKEDYEEED